MRCMTVVMDIAADGHRPALRVRPWLADMPDLLAAMEREYPEGGLRPNPSGTGALERPAG
jgi:hypothetical protein